jgi:hypothetical protein
MAGSGSSSSAAAPARDENGLAGKVEFPIQAFLVAILMWSSRQISHTEIRDDWFPC